MEQSKENSPATRTEVWLGLEWGLSGVMGVWVGWSYRSLAGVYGVLWYMDAIFDICV